MLYLVPTPIGNLKDITLRALEVLKYVDLIIAEDTRTSSNLLNHYQITKPLSPYHQHNEHKVLQHLVNQLLEGKKIALVTDAGTRYFRSRFFISERVYKNWGEGGMPTRRNRFCTRPDQ